MLTRASIPSALSDTTLPSQHKDFNEQIDLCREHIICPVFVARDLSGLGWPLKEGHYDMGTGATGGETDAL